MGNCYLLVYKPDVGYIFKGHIEAGLSFEFLVFSFEFPQLRTQN
jgi:hypothetical protein